MQGDIVHLKTKQGDEGCGHYFHKECLREWLAHSKGTAFGQHLCPICKQLIPQEVEDEVKVFTRDDIMQGMVDEYEELKAMMSLRRYPGLFVVTDSLHQELDQATAVEFFSIVEKHRTVYDFLNDAVWQELVQLYQNMYTEKLSSDMGKATAINNILMWMRRFFYLPVKLADRHGDIHTQERQYTTLVDDDEQHWHKNILVRYADMDEDDYVFWIYDGIIRTPKHNYDNFNVPIPFPPHIDQLVWADTFDSHIRTLPTLAEQPGETSTATTIMDDLELDGTFNCQAFALNLKESLLNTNDPNEVLHFLLLLAEEVNFWISKDTQKVYRSERATTLFLFLKYLTPTLKTWTYRLMHDTIRLDSGANNEVIVTLLGVEQV